MDGDIKQKKWILIRGDGKYSLGSFDGTKFQEESALFDSDGGPNFYATQTWENMQTGDGRRIQVAWMREGHYPDMPFNQQISFPRELTLRSTRNGPRLFREPIREITKLHKNEDSWTNVSLRAGQPLPLKPSGDLFHVKATLSIPQGASLTFHIRGVPLVINHQTITCGTKPLEVSGEIKNVEILIDRTSIEAFANNGEVSLSRCYLPTESGVSLRANNGPVTIQSLQVFELNSIWQ
ncbi:MAG TPA: GH32 C-terminal domain-containing protein [Abditibacteriaceae bacterium]